MKVLQDIAQLRAVLGVERRNEKRIGLVPTMGALHDAHLSLVDVAKKHSDVVVMSIFVNPTQFNDPGDLLRYPRQLEKDLSLARARGVDYIFSPEAEEIYPAGVESFAMEGGGCRILAGDRSRGLCGATRPGHFDGVVQVVNMLLNIVQPDVAVFGEKDYQQLKVIEQMVDDLHLGVQVVPAPLLRDEDGLAMSSRNSLLSDCQRELALLLPQTLQQAVDLVKGGESSPEVIRSEVLQRLSGSESLLVDYVELVDLDTLEPLKDLSSGGRLCAAVFVGEVRLIDNVLLPSQRAA